MLSKQDSKWTETLNSVCVFWILFLFNFVVKLVNRFILPFEFLIDSAPLFLFRLNSLHQSLTNESDIDGNFPVWTNEFSVAVFGKPQNVPLMILFFFVFVVMLFWQKPSILLDSSVGAYYISSGKMHLKYHSRLFWWNVEFPRTSKTTWFHF